MKLKIRDAVFGNSLCRGKVNVVGPASTGFEILDDRKILLVQRQDKDGLDTVAVNASASANVAGISMLLTSMIRFKE